MIRFWLLYVAALVRGWRYRWPHSAPLPKGHSGCTTGLRDWREVRDMWSLGWKPWCFHRVPGGGWSRTFAIPLSPDEAEWEERSAQEGIRQHERWLAEQREGGEA